VRVGPARGRALGERRRWTVEADAREPVKPHLLDQRDDLGLGTAQQDLAVAKAQAAGQRGQVQHQRRIGEHEPAEVDDHVGLCAQRPHERAPAAPLGRAVLVATAAQGRRLFVEVDDRANLPKPNPRTQAELRLAYTDGMATVDDVTDALRDVIDPELGLDFVELGLIYDVEVEAGDVSITYTLTSPGCPIGPQVSEQMVEFVSELDGVTDVRPTMTFSPPWTPDRMSEDAKFALGF
jgi:metal-sulfur cluster biosynthetic enzyme